MVSKEKGQRPYSYEEYQAVVSLEPLPHYCLWRMAIATPNGCRPVPSHRTSPITGR